MTHLKDFQQALILWEGDETLYCRMFASSLGKMALSWYHKLPSRSINSWEQLAEQFVGRFMISRTALKHFDSLTSMRKKTGDSLREYAARYVDLYNEVEECTEKQAVSVFRLGLSFGEKLRESLTLNPVETFSELMERVEQHAKLDDE